MKFEINKELLLKGLSTAKPFIGKSTIPALDCFYFQGNGKLLKIRVTNIEEGVTVETLCECKIKEPGEALLPWAKLFAVVSKMPEGIIAFESRENTMLITDDLCECMMIKMDPADYPVYEKEEIPLTEITPGIFIDGIKNTSFATDVGHNALSHILLKQDKNGVSIVGTDGRRLAIYRYKDNDILNQLRDKDVLIPARALKHICKVAERNVELSFGIGESHVLFKSSETHFRVRLTSASYPAYEKAIPKDSRPRVKVNRRALVTALKRVATMSDKQSNAVKVIIRTDELELKGKSPEYGYIKDILPILYQGDKIEILLNHEYLLQYLDVIEDAEVEISFKGKDKPIVINPIERGGHQGEGIYIIMPMQAQE